MSVLRALVGFRITDHEVNPEPVNHLTRTDMPGVAPWAFRCETITGVSFVVGRTRQPAFVLRLAVRGASSNYPERRVITAEKLAQRTASQVQEGGAGRG